MVTKAQAKAASAKAEVKADNLLARVAASPVSWVIIVGWSGACVVVGAVVFW